MLLLLFITQELLVERAGVWLLYSESAHPPRSSQSQSHGLIPSEHFNSQLF